MYSCWKKGARHDNLVEDRYCTSAETKSKLHDSRTDEYNKTIRGEHTIF